MRFSPFSVKSSQSQAPQALARATFGNWRALVALFTALAFVALLLTAATHHHSNALEDHECAVCSVAIQKIANTNLVDLPQMVAVLVFYAPFVSVPGANAHVTTLQLPPSCGPPSHFSAIV